MLGRVLGVAVAFVLAHAAHAYVPPSFYVVKMLAHKHAAVDQGRFRHKITVYKRNGEVLRTYSETLVLSDAEHAVVHVADETGAEVGSRARKLVGAKGSDIERPVPYDLLLLRDGASIYEHLRALGLPLVSETDLYAEKEGALPYKPEASVALMRLENRVAVVVGDVATKGSQAERTPQLWVEKDSYLPLKALFPSAPQAGMASEPLEYRFSGYQVFKNFLYPRSMSVYRNGVLWAKVETQDVKLGESGAGETAKAKADPDGDTKDFLEMYFKWVR